MSETLWLFTVAIGPILLIAAMYYAFSRNRQGNERKNIAKAERGAARLRDDLERDPEYKEE